MALLVMTRGISYARRERALKKAGSAVSIIMEPGAYAAQLGEEGTANLRRVIAQREKHLSQLEKQQIHLIMLGEKAYPKLLAQIHRPPHLLFVTGETDICDPFPVAVVGTRRADAYGVRQTRAIAGGLAQAGVCVVSGLAAGVDSAAHQGALDVGGRTIAVLGGAHDRFYPKESQPLMERMLACGGSVVTEYPPGTPPGRYSFLERNRIIAGLSLGVLVTQAPERSGAQRTVSEALSEGREVFALPGSVESEGSRLPHTLIADGAHLVTSADDVLKTLVIEPAENVRSVRQAAKSAPEKLPEPAQAEAAAQKEPGRKMPEGLGEEETAVYAALSTGERDFDALCMDTGIAPDELTSVLMMMEMDGLLEALAGLRYRLT